MSEQLGVWSILGLVKLNLEIKRHSECCVSVLLRPVCSVLFESFPVCCNHLYSVLSGFSLLTDCWPQIRHCEIKMDRLKVD